SHLVVYSDTEAELAATAYGEAVESQLMYLPGMMSRKSQLMPAVQAVLSA
ncbi:MAG: manganese-dependent inorganic pyrophosphatase, partial [Oleispira sp.]